MSKNKRVALAVAAVVVVLALAAGGYVLYWMYHPHLFIGVSVADRPEEDYHYELTQMVLSRHMGIPVAKSVQEDIMALHNWTNEVDTELRAYTAPCSIHVYGEVKGGTLTLLYTGYATTQAGETVDYRRQETFRLPVRAKDVDLPLPLTADY